jgi:carbon monoxide dehydrogenase subunit G
MNEFGIVTTINRPPEEVFAALHDFSKAPDWNPGLTEVRRPDDRPFNVGSELVYVGRFLGRSYESTAVCVEYIADKTSVTKTTSGPFHLEVHNTVEATDGGTRLTSLYRGESRGFFKLAEPVVVRLTKRQFETASENFKELLEADAL